MLPLLTAFQSKLLAVKVVLVFLLLLFYMISHFWKKTFYKVSISIPSCKWAHFKAFVKHISTGLKEETKFNVLPLEK